jgi:2-polyprenyl-6-methoxyphenol hydroxylase-like FAD-dependent oxidoreductase
MATTYDAIIVGARCAGSPTAMLLARQGLRVLLVDHAKFPSDTVSTQVIHAPGVAALERWNLLEPIAKQTPPMAHYSFDFGSVVIKGTARTVDGHSTAYAPRRTLLDKLLIDAAADAGAEVREGFSVDEILFEDGVVVGIRGRDADGGSTVERATVVIGADGRNSRVARAVGARAYNDVPPLQIGYYSYWRDLPTDGFEIFIRPERGFAAIPTNDDLTLVLTGWPVAEREANKVDVEGNFFKTLDLAPGFAERVRAASRVERFVGGSVTNYFRQPYGPGWVLIGDAGYCKDPVTAQGIKDAFRDAEACAAGLGSVFRGEARFDQVMADYQRARDEAALPLYGFTTEFATLEPPPAEMQRLFAAMQGNQQAMDGFVGVIAGTVSPVEFFHPDHIGQIFVAASISVSAPAD